MAEQISDTIMMVRPAAFQMNAETAVNNYFQSEDDALTGNQAQNLALEEFDTFVETLRSEGIKVVVFQDKIENGTPDSIFPNNWNSFHDDGRIILYPMFAENRRKERSQKILDSLAEEFVVSDVISITDWEKQGLHLEGTGSMILDRQNKISYAALSDRTNKEVLDAFANRTGYEVVAFTSNQSVNNDRLPIYHTNVMMCVGESFAVICADSIDDEEERRLVLNKLVSSGKELVLINEEQIQNFAGNMLQVRNDKGDRFVVMSEKAYQSLGQDQIETLKRHGSILKSNIDTIENLGGGGVRCMMAEVFLPRK